MKKSLKVLAGVGIVVAFIGILYALTGSSGKNEHFKPVDEFRLEPWISIHIGSLDLSITKAVVYLFIAAFLTCATMLYIANRMQQRPNRVQTAVEFTYQFMKNGIAGANMDRETTTKWFPFVGTVFLFIWFSNMIGYIPLPTNTAHSFNLFGLEIPSFALYAATANISIPLVLTLVVWLSYHVVGVRAKGPIGYVKGWLPSGISGGMAVPIFVIEVISQFVRVVSLSVRLFANILAGHLLILFMGGGLAVILGLAALSVITVPVAVVFFLFEIGLIATLQAFIFATLAAIYLGEAVSDHH